MNDHTTPEEESAREPMGPTNERSERRALITKQLTSVDRLIWWMNRIAIGMIVVSLTATVVILALRDDPLPGRARHTGKALVKSEFNLVNHLGQRVTQKDFAGRWQLVFFGFTYCPDVCPTTLASMGKVIDDLGKDADKVAPIFITVDPLRDTPKILAEYVTAIHPKLIGLTGTPDEIKAAAKAFRIYYSKVDKEDAPDGYLMDHSGYIYLMTPKGAYEAVFTEKSDPPVVIAESIRQRL